MNDEADQAEAATDAFLREALSRAKKPSGPERVDGICGNCGSDTAPGQAYCDADCREDAEHRYKTLSRTVAYRDVQDGPGTL